MRARLAIGLLVATLGLLGCRPDMNDQHKLKPHQISLFFADGRGDRPVVPGTVARGQLRTNAVFYAGRDGNQLVALNPLPITPELLARGRERYDIFCAVCHDRVGTGQGTIVRRGFKQPSSFHNDRLREAPDGYFFDVMTQGFGAMARYSDRVEPADRWAIVAYIRALQLSQRAALADAPELEREQLLQLPPE